MTDLTVSSAQIGVVFPDNAEIYDFIAAEALTAGQPVYMLTAAGTVGVADANAANKQQFRGIALSTVGAGQAVSVLKRGHIYGFTLAGDYDSMAYLSDTAGKLADAAGTLTVIVGRVVGLPDNSNTKILYVVADWLREWS